MTETLVNDINLSSIIYEIRGQKVMLDRDLAKLYNTSTKRINEQVKRNSDRFESFYFQLNDNELKNLRSQFATTNISYSNKSRSLPYAFTEHGIIMLSSVLNTDTAIQVNRRIIKIFIELRKQISFSTEFLQLKEKVQRLENEQLSMTSLIDNTQLNQKIDNSILSSKMTQLSKDVFRLTEILDEFQNNHLIIKRSEDYISD